ncbi:MAG: class I SAM-dependent methyltransferase [Oscillospiraceae bacterium]
MRFATNWIDYELLDASGGEKLERWGDVLLVRPDPQVIWDTPKGSEWDKANAHYVRSAAGGGQWQIHLLPKSEWNIAYRTLRFCVRPTGFKHTGLFPEQAVNWDFMDHAIRAADRPIRILNLFAYTGGATLACAAAGAQVTHVDAAKGMVQWARDNARLSGLENAPIRWIVDDCKKFLEREERRGTRYDGIVMDPPSYGRGPGGEIWKLSDSVFELVTLATSLLSENPLFFILNSYTTGLSPSVMHYLLAMATRYRGGQTSADEIGLSVSHSGLVLPQGSTAIWKI